MWKPTRMCTFFEGQSGFMQYFSYQKSGDEVTTYVNTAATVNNHYDDGCFTAGLGNLSTTMYLHV